MLCTSQISFEQNVIIYSLRVSQAASSTYFLKPVGWSMTLIHDFMTQGYQYQKEAFLQTKNVG